jgi:outer membrane protein assembly factor BamD (BamD/ComL family)
VRDDLPLDPVASSLASFRDGWQALRAADYATAITAFDRATDAVVIEDATFWAAIACERASRRDEATRRLQAFIARFPDSPRVTDARAALTRLGR